MPPRHANLAVEGGIFMLKNREPVWTKEGVHQCEARFAERLAEIAAEIGGREHLRLCTLTGPTCSGKTTAAEIIARESNMVFHRLNATTASLSDVKDVFCDIISVRAQEIHPLLRGIISESFSIFTF